MGVNLNQYNNLRYLEEKDLIESKCKYVGIMVKGIGYIHPNINYWYDDEDHKCGSYHYLGIAENNACFNYPTLLVFKVIKTKPLLVQELASEVIFRVGNYSDVEYDLVEEKNMRTFQKLDNFYSQHPLFLDSNQFYILDDICVEKVSVYYKNNKEVIVNKLKRREKIAKEFYQERFQDEIEYIKPFAELDNLKYDYEHKRKLTR